MKAQALAKLRYLRMSPRKARLLIERISGMKTQEALAELAVSKKRAALPVLKLLKSAIANATHNASLDAKTLTVAKAFVDGGPILYRSTPRAHGRATPIRKRTSHITIVLEGEKKETKKQEIKKQETGNENREPKSEI
ncbi:MAG: 50S ribosomal protein L22 [Candidatus Magasanikbacteria bacterium RIFCSPHIGHO2_02_FULL_51_14]|uniref:Large ribosomal subunit protein uL22 n=1 Tax=Candidatus Magasanikbacteria bacterium RIFCSPHIGHO2_02_FULL_51_14 TaxID=1798683 RepID=A0A1F6MHN3_9BACT|nr:MAG: 50S ribosomal protein L22 [Candidatus Magasanikbacteria bacterium RIFCSPHIGHO2_02_FULL_51_14]